MHLYPLDGKGIGDSEYNTKEFAMRESDKLLLKKYGNRRLYDTEKSAYVTLNEVAEVIRKGIEIEVIDANTKEDVTAYILTQIILEQAKNKNALLPTGLLHLIIRYGDGILHEFFEKYLHQTISSYLQFKKVADEQFGKWIEMQMNYSDLARKTFSGIAPFQDIFKAQSKKPEKGRK
jgi:polyhydroxyalkanoate synthesis repressor PhaR